MLTLRKRALAALASLALLFSLGAATAVPAQASTPPDQPVCNSINSVTVINVWSSQAWWPERILARGQCVTFSHGATVRVDVDPDDCCGLDVDSYYIGTEGQGYGKCHQGENTASDPPDDAPLYVKYNTNAGSC
jgi:hypothetical protein